jgi:hypothetical protein
MKTLAPKVSVALAIFTLACGAAITTANAAGKLKGLSWAILPLFVIAGAALAFAVITIVRAPKDPTTPASESAMTTTEDSPEEIHVEDLIAIFDDKTEIQAQLYVKRWIGKRVRVNAPLADASALSGGGFMVSLRGRMA